MFRFGSLTGAAVHGFLQDLELIVELCKQGALAKRTRDEATLQLVGDVVAGCDLLLGVCRLGQQLHQRTNQTVSRHRDGPTGHTERRDPPVGLPCTV